MIRWGIAGTGAIAQRFADAMTLVHESTVVAVASRTMQSASDFASRFDIGRAHPSYESLALDPEVDAVYVATPNHRHGSDTELFLRSGKHVLCEKPFALNGRQARSMVAAAKANDRFLMEALWSRFLPSYRQLAALHEDATIGDVRFVEASFGFAAPLMPDHRLFDRHLGGGSLLDVGIYPLQLCSMMLGAPEAVSATATIGSTGVDEQMIVGLRYANGSLAMVSSAIRTNLRCDARIVGERGVIELPAFMHCPDRVIVSTRNNSRTIECGWEGDGLRFQIDEVNDCIRSGRVESSVMTLSDTVALADLMDEIRAQVGVVYPGDEV